MIENIHIEGLDYTQDHDLFSDTPPDAIITQFSVVSEVMPYLSTQAGREVRKNFVYVSRTYELGRSSYSRRIYDTVEMDEATGKWKILQLAPLEQSDIKRNPNEWNAFMRGATAEPVGTPLSVLFKNDPSRVAMYASHHLKTIEQLALLNHTDRQSLGLGVGDDCKKAEAYLEKVKAAAPSLEIAAKLEEKDRQLEMLQKQLSEMNMRMNELLTAKEEEIVKPRARRAILQPEG